MEIKQPLELLGMHLTGRWWMDSRAEFIIWKKIDAALRPSRPSAPRSAAERGEENKTATGIAFHEVVNRQRRGGSPWPFASSQSRSSPRAFTGFDEKAPSRCVNHEPLRRFFESHPLSEETEPKRRRRDSTVRSESFLRARIHTQRATTRARCPQILCASLQFHCRITNFEASSETPSDFPKTAHESDFCFPRVLPFCPYHS